MSGANTYDAIVVHEHGDPSVLKLEKKEVPSALQPSQILIKVFAVGVNPYETYLRAGLNGYKANLPYTPGADAAGEVEAVGSQVKKFKVGDRVWTTATVTGAYASKAVVEEKTAFPLPSNTSYEQVLTLLSNSPLILFLVVNKAQKGAALNVPYATAYRALYQRGKVKPGQTVFIHGGSGGVGIAAIQFARAVSLLFINHSYAQRLYKSHPRAEPRWLQQQAQKQEDSLLSPTEPITRWITSPRTIFKSF